MTFLEGEPFFADNGCFADEETAGLFSSFSVTFLFLPRGMIGWKKHAAVEKIK